MVRVLEIAAVMDDGSNSSNSNNNNKLPNEKATQAYKLFSEGKKPVEIAIQLNLSEKEATRFYTEYWRLKRLYSLYHIYQESKGNLSYILKLCRLAKRHGITADNIEWFVNMVNIGKLDNMNNQVSILRRTMYQLSATCNDKRNEISYLKNQIQVLEGCVNGRNQEQQEGIQNKSYI
jgi:hypothetical protein